MPEPGALWAAWSDEALWIQGRGPRAQLQRLARRMMADHRYFLRLYRLAGGAVWLRSGDGHRTLLDVADAAGIFHPLAGWPDEVAALPPYRVVPLADGSVAGLLADEPRLLLWRPGARPALRNVPAGFLARDVARDATGRLWVAGSVPTGKLASLERRHALAVSEDEGGSWQVSEAARGRLWDAWCSLLSGAETEYRTVQAVGEHVVVTAEAGDVDDGSALVFVRDAAGHWHSGGFRHDVFRAALALGKDRLDLVSHYGKGIHIEGRRWLKFDLVPRIRAALGTMRSASLARSSLAAADLQYEILAADGSPEGRVLLLLSIRSSRERMARVGEAVVVLRDGEDEAWSFQGSPGPETITALWMPG